MAERLKLTVACGDYEIVRALKEGAVKADGLDLVMLTGMGPRERHWRMARKAEFDVCEANVGAYFMERDHGAARADEPGSGRVSSARSRASSDALCARTVELPRWPLASLASAVRAMARMVAASETRPPCATWRSRNARSSRPASRRLSENERSPPRITRPSRARPSMRAEATELTPAIAITPSAMQAMNT